MTRQTGKERLGWRVPGLCKFMRTQQWEALIMMCLEEGGMKNKRVGGRVCCDVSREWWDNFAEMCVYAWRTERLSRGYLGTLRECSMKMGKTHLLLRSPYLLWAHLYSNHMYFFARKWRILSKFSCFAMEGRHRRVKRMLRNSGGLSLMCGRLGVRVVVNNHTTNYSLRREESDVTKRSMLGQGPAIVQQLARCARKTALSNLTYVHVRSQCFTIRTRRA